MIELNELEILLSRYGVDYNKVVDKNDNVLRLGISNDIKYVLDFLVFEKGVSPSSIERSPSILYLNVDVSSDDVKDNYCFLEYKGFSKERIENCLHVLSTNSSQLKDTYSYVIDNYGEHYLEKIVSILSVSVSRIKDFEGVFKRRKVKDKALLLSVCCVFNGDVTELNNVIKVCQENNVKLSSVIFQRTFSEIKEIIRVCRGKKLSLRSSIFYRLGHEIEDIIRICDKYQVDICDTIFTNTPDLAEAIILVCRKNEIEISGSVFLRTPLEIEKIVSIYMSRYGKRPTASVFHCKPDGLDRILDICDNYDMEPVGVIFIGKPDELEKIIKICRRENIEAQGSVFYRTAQEIEDIICICRENKIEIINSVFSRRPLEVRKIIDICKKNNIKVIGSMFEKGPQEVEDIVNVCLELDIKISGSLFKTSVSEIKKINKVYREKLEIRPSATVFYRTSLEIEEIIDFCIDKGVTVCDSMFLKTPLEVKEIVMVCLENGLEPYGNVFKRTAIELNDLIRVCRENNIDYKKYRSVLACKPRVLDDSIKFVRDKYGDKYLLPGIIVRDRKILEPIFKLLEDRGILEMVLEKNNTTIFTLMPDDAENRMLFLEDKSIPVVIDNKINGIFGLSNNRLLERYGVNKKMLDERYRAKRRIRKI